MSVDAGLIVRFEQASDWSSVRLVRVLLDIGWRFDDGGFLVYLPLGDNDAFDWQREESCRSAEAWKTLEKKEQAGETIGVVLTWKDTQIGGEFRICPDATLSVSPSKNRQTCDSEGNTDVTWYLQRILPVRKPVGTAMVNWAWAEYR